MAESETSNYRKLHKLIWETMRIDEDAATGSFSRTDLLIHGLSQETRLGISHTTATTADYSQRTMLVGALIMGKMSFVQYLLKEGFGDTEYVAERKITVFELLGFEVDRHNEIKPLCSAAGTLNNLEAVQILVQHGADVNAVSAETTPLLSACRMSRPNMRIVRYLVEHGADVNRPHRKGVTCLMDSTHDAELSRYLIQQGALVNAVSDSIKTALHYAVEVPSRYQTVEVLLEYGADPLLRNEDDEDALQLAALCESEVTVEHFIRKHPMTPSRKADCYSLLAATIMNSEDVERALPFFIKAAKIRMEQATEDENDNIPNAAYNFAIEAKDVDSLMNIATDIDAMTMQSLVVRERILGPHHRETVYGVLRKARMYRNLGFHQRYIDVWLHVLCNLNIDISEKDASINHQALNDLCTTLHTIWTNEASIIHSGDLMVMLHGVSITFRRMMQSTLHCTSNNSSTWVNVALLLIHLISCLTLTETETRKFRQHVRELIQTKFRTLDGHTILHHAASYVLWVDEEDSAITEQPASAVVECILRAGADANVIDSTGNTPLHIAVFSRPSRARTEDCQKTIELLVDYGAHIDIANDKRQIASNSGTLPSNVDVFSHVSLQCLAARALREHNVPYLGIIPKPLYDFVKSH